METIPITLLFIKLTPSTFVIYVALLYLCRHQGSKVTVQVYHILLIDCTIWMITKDKKFNINDISEKIFSFRLLLLSLSYLVLLLDS